MGKKLDKLAALRSGMAAAAEWDKQLEWVRDTVISIEDKLSEAAGDSKVIADSLECVASWASSVV